MGEAADIVENAAGVNVRFGPDAVMARLRNHQCALPIDGQALGLE